MGELFQSFPAIKNTDGIGLRELGREGIKWVLVIGVYVDKITKRQQRKEGHQASSFRRGKS